jgi:NADH dehydrogenase FAD-containing subunit
MAEHGSSAARGDVVIAGGGVAALEALMALAHLAGERVRVTLVSPEPDFGLRPLTVAEPFALAAARRYPLREIADEFDARLVRAGVRAVDAAARRVELCSGDQLGYDTLILAPGARAQIAGRYLAPYLFAREPGADPGPPPPGLAHLELALEEDVPAPAAG